MALIARALGVAPNPLALARALADRPGLALLWSAWGEGPSFVACDPVERSSGWDPEPSLPRRAGGPLASLPRWIGALPYEATRSLERPGRTRQPEPRPAPELTQPEWLRYPALARVAGGRVEVVGEDERAVAGLSELLMRAPVAGAARARLLEAPEPGEVHAARIRRALELIAAGELYQVNLARRFRLEVEGHPLELLAAMSARAPAPFAACLRLGACDVLSTSPELFLELEPSGTLTTVPIKGTRPRGASAEEDARLAAELDADPKERAELSMILDVERNDLGRVARTGSVRLVDGPRVVRYPTLHHREAVLSAELRPDMDRAGLLRAMLPSGSVTGAPKVRAMEVIAELEPARRGLYTGAFGYVSHAGGLRLAMAIRTLTLARGEAHYFAGGGIVADSDPEREVEETTWKARQLAALLAPGSSVLPWRPLETTSTSPRLDGG